MAHEFIGSAGFDSINSVYREKLIEHLLLGELLRHSWFEGALLEVSRPVVDRAGHDLVLEVGQVCRHVQLKTSSVEARTVKQNVHVSLAARPSGCVLWVRFEPSTLKLSSFLFYGNQPGDPMDSVHDCPVAKHSKANSSGVKALRPSLRTVKMNQFRRIEGIPALYAALFAVHETRRADC
jgi:hypothetical protein